VSERALSLTQPWASLVAWGDKRVETRSWRTSHRGRLGIHASSGFPREAVELCFTAPFSAAFRAAGVRKPAELPRGVLLGFTELLDCIPTESHDLASREIGEVECAFGDYGPGRWAWLLGDFEPLPEPLPMRGALSLWTIPPAASPPRSKCCGSPLTVGGGDPDEGTAYHICTGCEEPCDAVFPQSTGGEQ